MTKAMKLVGAVLGLLLWGAAQAGTVTYVYTDPQGTPLMETDAQGNITARYEYTPYGVPVASVGAAPDGVGYTGHVNDPETGLVYMQARYYDAEVGRFLSVDPVASVSGSRYAYANNNSLRYIDPDGRQAAQQDGQSNSEVPAPCDLKCRQQRQEERRRRNNEPFTGGGLWQGLKDRSSFTAEGSAALGGGVTASGTKEVGKSADSLGGSFVIGEGVMVSATYNFKVWAGAKEASNGFTFTLDPSSYLKVKLGAGLALGFVIKTDPYGAHDISLVIGGGIGEEVIYKPPVNVGVNYNIK